MRWASVVTGILLAGGLAGCVSQDSSRGGRATLEEIVLVGGETCPSDVVENCTDIKKDPEAPILIANKTIVGNKEEIGVFIQDVARSIILDNVTIIGFVHGLYISRSGCETCSITIKGLNITDLRAKTGATEVGFGVNLEQVSGIVSIRESVIVVPGGGMVLRGQLAGIPVEGSDGGYAAVVAEGAFSLEIRRTRLAAEEPSVLPGVMASPNGVRALEIVESSFEGFRFAVDVHRTEQLRISSIDVKCASSGVHAVGPRPTDVQNASSSGIRARDSGDIRLENVSVDGCTDTAFLLLGYQSIAARRIRASNSTYGMLAWIHPPGGESRLNVSDSFFVDNVRAGLWTSFASGEIYRTTFRANGHGSDEAEDATEPRGGVITMWSSLKIRQSKFEKNDGYGVVAWSGPDIPDARLNWWDDPSGPKIRLTAQPSAAPSVGGGSGDTVSDRVLFLPYLQEPPRDSKFPSSQPLAGPKIALSPFTNQLVALNSG